MSAISNDWLEPLSPEFKKPYYAKLYKTVKESIALIKSFRPQMIFSMHLRLHH